jgi:hypothetical protein
MEVDGGVLKVTWSDSNMRERERKGMCPVGRSGCDDCSGVWRREENVRRERESWAPWVQDRNVASCDIGMATNAELF